MARSGTPAAPIDTWLGQELDIFRYLQSLGDDEVPYSLFPERPGLLPWGSDDNGNTLCWLTEGEPHEWPIIAKVCRYNYYEHHRMSMTSFLAGCFTRRVMCVLWKDPEFFVDPRDIRFDPTRGG
jgi:hypothetical protein